MTTPVDENSEPQYHSQDDANQYHYQPSTIREKASDEGTIVGEDSERNQSPVANRGRSNTHLTLEVPKDYHDHRSLQSPSQTREQAHRLDDDLAMLQVEQQVSQSQESGHDFDRTRSIRRSRSKREEPVILGENLQEDSRRELTCSMVFVHYAFDSHNSDPSSPRCVTVQECHRR